MQFDYLISVYCLHYLNILLWVLGLLSNGAWLEIVCFKCPLLLFDLSEGSKHFTLLLCSTPSVESMCAIRTSSNKHSMVCC